MFVKMSGALLPSFSLFCPAIAQPLAEMLMQLVPIDVISQGDRRPLLHHCPGIAIRLTPSKPRKRSPGGDDCSRDRPVRSSEVATTSRMKRTSATFDERSWAPSAAPMSMGPKADSADLQPVASAKSPIRPDHSHWPPGAYSQKLGGKFAQRFCDATLNGSGRAACFHPEFLALCGYFCLQPIACERRDPESKGIVEGGVRYVKHNALAGRAEELIGFEDYRALACLWRDQVANVRMHETTRERPVDRFQRERSVLRPLPATPFDTDELVLAVVSPHARIEFDGNRYSTPPGLARRPVTIRASRDELRVLHEGQVVAQHVRCYERGQLIVLPEDRLAAFALRRRSGCSALENEFDALGLEARQFHFQLNSQPVKTSVHLRRLLGLTRLYGPKEVLSAISRALELATYDAAYVENLLLAERRRRQLPTPTLPTPRRRELIDEIELEPANPAIYDRFCNDTEEDSHGTT